jgi:hypothetical protein
MADKREQQPQQPAPRRSKRKAPLAPDVDDAQLPVVVPTAAAAAAAAGVRPDEVKGIDAAPGSANDDDGDVDMSTGNDRGASASASASDAGRDVCTCPTSDGTCLAAHIVRKLRQRHRRAKRAKATPDPLQPDPNTTLDALLGEVQVGADRDAQLARVAEQFARINGLTYRNWTETIDYVSRIAQSLHGSWEAQMLSRTVRPRLLAHDAPLALINQRALTQERVMEWDLPTDANVTAEIDCTDLPIPIAWAQHPPMAGIVTALSGGHLFPRDIATMIGQYVGPQTVPPPNRGTAAMAMVLYWPIEPKLHRNVLGPNIPDDFDELGRQQTPSASLLLREPGSQWSIDEVFGLLLETCWHRIGSFLTLIRDWRVARRAGLLGERGLAFAWNRHARDRYARTLFLSVQLVQDQFLEWFWVFRCAHIDGASTGFKPSDFLEARSIMMCPGCYVVHGVVPGVAGPVPVNLRDGTSHRTLKMPDGRFMHLPWCTRRIAAVGAPGTCTPQWPRPSSPTIAWPRSPLRPAIVLEFGPAIPFVATSANLPAYGVGALTAAAAADAGAGAGGGGGGGGGASRP